MGLPRHVGSAQSGSGHDPFGQKAFRGAVIGCVVLVVVGLLLVLMAGTAWSSVGASFLTLGILGLVTAGGGLLAERLLDRKPPPPPELTSRNGRDGRSLHPSRIERLRRPLRARSGCSRPCGTRRAPRPP